MKKERDAEEMHEFTMQMTAAEVKWVREALAHQRRVCPKGGRHEWVSWTAGDQTTTDCAKCGERL